MARDISNNVVAVLLVLVVAVAAFGTFAFLNGFQPATGGSQTSHGQVSLSLPGAGPTTDATSSGQAAVQLTVAATEG